MSENAQPNLLSNLVGVSKPIQEVVRLVGMVSPLCAPVLITGETGTGKEIVARTIHQLSPRAKRPFVAINCSAISEALIESEIFGQEKGALADNAPRRVGCFELANGGTLLLDEIDALPEAIQARLLRVLEGQKIRRLGSGFEIPTDVRVLATMRRELGQAVSTARLRQDLYFFFRIFHIPLPPLRERREDFPILIEHILGEANLKYQRRVRGVNAEVAGLFGGYTWPGNLRELRSVLEHAVVACTQDMIREQDLPPDFGRSLVAPRPNLSSLRFPLGTTVEELERELVLQTLAATGNNKTRAAELLGISLKTLHNKLKLYSAEDRPARD